MPAAARTREIITARSPEAETKGLKLDRFEKWMWEIHNQPAWRMQADVEADYYDSNQLDSATLAEMTERGIPPLITNLIAPTIDAVLGMEAKSRTDWKVTPDDEDDTDLAEALNVKLHEAERISMVDRAISDAYAGQIKTGLHWVEVSREFDPFKPKYRVKAVHRREIWWDWFAREPDLSDARYLVRKRWFDEDLVLMMFPGHEKLIQNAVGGWNDWSHELAEAEGSMWMMRQWGLQQSSSIDEQEWLDAERERVCLHECWYREWVKGKILRLPNDVIIEFDPKNPRQAQAVAAGVVQPEPTIMSKVRLSWWLGPHRLVDMATPYPHNRFPYVPFFGKREDRTSVPYGMIRSMISPQDEVNARKSKMMWLLSSKRVIADEDAVKDHNAAAREVARPDAYIKLNPARRNLQGAFTVEDDAQLSMQQFSVMQEAKQEIQDSAGVYQQMLGKDVAGGATSGVAINSLVEQGTVTLAEINDNHRYARMAVGELLLSLVKEDIGALPVTVIVNRGSEREHEVVFNQPGLDPQGNQMRTNDINRVKARVVLEDVPSTPTYRAQQLRDLTELTKALPPELQAAVIDIVIEGTDNHRKDEIADRIRSVTGFGKKTEDMSEEEQAAAQAQAEFAQQMQELQLREQAAKTALAEANAEFTDAKTEKTLAETAKLEQDTDHEIENHALTVAQGAKQLTSPEPRAGGKK